MESAGRVRSRADQDWFRKRQESMSAWIRENAADKEADVERLLVDPVEWINVFRKPNFINLLTKDNNQLVIDQKNPVERFLVSLDPENRQRLFLDFVDSYIPQEVQKNLFERSQKYDATKSNRTERPTLERIQSLRDNNELEGVRDALTLMFNGQIEKEGDDKDPKYVKATELAKQSLETRFGVKEGEVPTSITLDKKLANDYKDALRYLHLAGYPPSATAPERLNKVIGSSPLLGAMKLGVINTQALEYLNKDLDLVRTEWDQTIGKVGAQLDEQLGLSKEHLKSEGKDLMQVWNESPSWVKLALVVGGIYAFAKSKIVRWSVVGVAATYLGIKYFANVDKPGTAVANVVGDGWRRMMGGNKPLYGRFSSELPGSLSNPGRRAELMVDFLSEYDRDNLEAEANFFGELANIQLADLAGNFEVHPGGSPTTWLLHTENGKTIDKLLYRTNKNYNHRKLWDRKSENGHTLKEQGEDALSYVFYLHAVMDPDNAGSIDDQRGYLYVEHEVGRLRASQGYMELTGKAREEYARLVGRGKLMAERSSQTLAEFVASVMPGRVPQEPGVQLAQVDQMPPIIPPPAPGSTVNIPSPGPGQAPPTVPPPGGNAAPSVPPAAPSTLPPTIPGSPGPINIPPQAPPTSPTSIPPGPTNVPPSVPPGTIFSVPPPQPTFHGGAPPQAPGATPSSIPSGQRTSSPESKNNVPPTIPGRKASPSVPSSHPEEPSVPPDTRPEAPKKIPPSAPPKKTPGNSPQQPPEVPPSSKKTA
jgi:hypothetical protein